jgi:hypothetical protein
LTDINAPPTLTSLPLRLASNIENYVHLISRSLGVCNQMQLQQFTYSHMRNKGLQNSHHLLIASVREPTGQVIKLLLMMKLL